MLVLRGGGDWLDRTLRIPRRPPGLGPPPDEVPAPQIIGRPSEVEPLLERAGQRAAEMERAAAQNIKSFASQQLAEASKGFVTAAEAAVAAVERQPRQRLVREPWRCWARSSGDGGHGGCCGWRSGPWEQVLPWSARRGPSKKGSTRLRTLWAGALQRKAADPEQDARKRSRGPLLYLEAAEGPAEAARGLQDRHGVGERAQKSAAATDPKPPGKAFEATNANPLRLEQRSHPRILRQQTVPGKVMEQVTQAVQFFLAWLLFSHCLIPDLRFAFHLALCVRLSGRGQKKAPEVQKKMSRGSKKDPGFATRCFGSNQRLLKIMHRG